MQWLSKIADEAEARQPKGKILIESGASPSGVYHVGHLREIVTANAIKLELEKRGRRVRHVQFIDDLDGLRKLPPGVPATYEKYLGQSLCDIPAPDGSPGSYADFYLKDFLASAKTLRIQMEVIRSHERYRAGFFTPAIEKVLQRLDQARSILEKVSGRQLGEEWSPIQVNEDGYLKKRPFVSLDPKQKTLRYLDKDGAEKETSYAAGEVKLDWRLDWPARWWLLKVDVEPSGRDHHSSGGSFDTGRALMPAVFDTPPPIGVAYDFINRAGDTAKMSASKGTGISVSDIAAVLPPEVVHFFILRYPPSKRLYFDPERGVTRLIDEFAELLAKPKKSADEQRLIEICLDGSGGSTVSSLPFSHLVASYQAALKDPGKTLEIIARTEHGQDVAGQEDVIKKELQFIDQWLQKWAPEDVKFELRQKINISEFSVAGKQFLKILAQKIAAAPANTDGDWFHKTIYDLATEMNMEPKAAFETLYKVLIGKSSGPRAGWFLSILPRDWLIKRLNLEA